MECGFTGTIFINLPLVDNDAFPVCQWRMFKHPGVINMNLNLSVAIRADDRSGFEPNLDDIRLG